MTVSIENDDSFHWKWNWYTPEIHQIQKPEFLTEENYASQRLSSDFSHFHYGLGF